MKHGQQKLIASAAGIKPSYMSKILSGKRRPTWPVAKRLSKATNTSPSDWMEGAEAIKAALAAVDDKAAA